MTTLWRAVGAVTALGVALGGLTSCTAADRAVFTAPRCSDAEASPTAVRHAPGQAVLMAPVLRSSLPTGPVRGWEQVVSVADGGTTLAAVHPDGTVSVVGTSHKGSLAGTDAGAEQTLSPHTVPGITDAVAVAAVGSAFLVTHSDGTITAWGDDLILGGGRRGDERSMATPTRVDGVENVVAVAEGALNVLALRSDGGITGWGVNLTDILGDPDDTRVRDISDAPGAVSVANTGDAAVTATGTGEVCAWGNNVNGLLGVEPRGGQTTRPVRVGSLEGITDVAGGHDFALALDSDGGVWAWGRIVSGVLGDGTVENTATASPQRVPGLPPVEKVYASGSASYAIDAEGALWAWGKNHRVAPYESEDIRPRVVTLPGPVQEVSGNLALLGPLS